MRPFKKIMLLDYKPQFIGLCYYGDSVKSHPYILTVREISWWGLRDRIVKTTVEVPFSFDVVGFYEPKLNVWIKP